MSSRKRYAVCGVSDRGISTLIRAIARDYRDVAELCGLLDVDPLRFEVCARRVPESRGVPRYGGGELDRMLDEARPDVLVVTAPDGAHAGYAVRALERGLDVIVEKPLATTARDCARVLEAERASGRKVTVTFNFRYPPLHQAIKRILLEGRVGRITHVDFDLSVDTLHGASYFRRWHRRRESSGGLAVHKCSHHFDLVGWWLEDEPVEVFAYGGRNHYMPRSEWNPAPAAGRHCGTCEDAPRCAYHRHWASWGRGEHHAGARRVEDYTSYRPDACIFDPEIDVEDTYAAMVRFRRGAVLAYSATFSAPYEGYRLVIHGTRGRLEATKWLAPARLSFPAPETVIELHPLFGPRETIRVATAAGGHDGADPLLIEDVLLGEAPGRAFPILAGAREGALAVAVGVGMHCAMAERRPIRIAEVLGGWAGAQAEEEA